MEELLARKRQCFVRRDSGLLGKVACSAFLVGSTFKEFIMEGDLATNDLPREVLDDFED